MVAHRKQGPALPTLVINISPDPTTDKLRKRRSSRTVGLTTTKETSPTTLMFRLAAGDKESSLQAWARFIQPLIQPTLPDRPPMSPITPASPTFMNPFGPRREPIESFQRPSSGNANLRAALQHKGSTQTQSSRDRPVTYSESASLRSRRSDLSSHTSSMNPSYMGFQNYTTVHPTDLPSPATTIGEYQGEFIEGWTAAQGRSSALSSPIRGGRESISSQPALSSHGMVDSSSPPRPRETILDRAFQLRCIPGSEREVPGEEKLSSLARFDALMREADEKMKAREAEEARIRAANSELKSAWDLDEDDDDESESGSDRLDEEDDDDSDDAGESLDDPDDRYRITPTEQRALDYITGRRDPGSRGDRSPLSYNHETLMTLNSGSSHHLRPQTGYSRNRPGSAQRTHSQPHLVGIIPTSPSVSGMSPRPSGKKTSEEGAGSSSSSSSHAAATTTVTATATSLHRSATEKRQSASSVKRLSFTEFTKRLSSTSSSLLLVQTNASSISASSRNSETDSQQAAAARGTALNPRGGPTPVPSAPLAERDSLDKRCGWRGSVGVFGGEGGFL